MSMVSSCLIRRYLSRPLGAAVCALWLGALLPAESAHAIDEVALRTYQQTFAREVCSAGGGFLRCFQLDSSTNCKEVFEGIIGRCTRHFMEQYTAGNDIESEARAMSEKIIQCVEKDFRERFEAFKLNSDECKRF